MTTACNISSSDRLMCEWGDAQTIIMHTPGDEITTGLLHPRAALFEKHFHLVKASEEHRQYMTKLTEEGVQVLTVQAILLKAAHATDNETLVRLQELAAQALKYKYIGEFTKDEISVEEDYKRQLIQKMNPEELFWIVTNRPTIKLKKTEINTGMRSSVHLHPLMNLFFLRDQMITTSKGVVLARMNSPQRAPETDIIRLTLETCGMKPIYEIQEPGRLEGGDFIPAGKIAFLGQGLRTNAAAVQQLIENDAFGNIQELVVVKDPLKDQDQMHLDTYFNIINPKLAVLIESRFPESQEKFIKTKVDIYQRTLDENGVVNFEVKKSDVDFTEYMQKELGMTLIRVSEEDQLNYGINFLTFKENKIMVAKGISESYKQELESKGVEVEEIDLGELTSGFGSTHCTTQVVQRALSHS